MKTFLQFLTEDLSPETVEALGGYENFPPNQPSPNEEEYYDNIEFLDFKHYMSEQIATVSEYIASQGITEQDHIKQALNDAFMKPEIQRAFRLHYATQFPDKVNEKR